MSFDQVKAHLLGLYGSVRSPVTTAAMRGCEARLRVELPEDVRAAYDIMDGADHPTDPHSSWVRFWPIEEWKLAKASLPPTASLEDQDSLFILADYGIECVYYAIDLKRRAIASKLADVGRR